MGERAGGAGVDLYHGDGGGKLETACHLYVALVSNLRKGTR